MVDKEIIAKLTGLVVFEHLRLEGLEGEGKESVVLRATDIRDKKQLVLKLYQSNPMFLLNEPDFNFQPSRGSLSERTPRFVTIAEKLVLAGERDQPGLFFWHVESIYERLLVGLCSDFKEYGTAVMDTTTSLFQNDELISVANKVVTRKAQLDLFELEYWEMYIDAVTLQAVARFVSAHPFSQQLNFRKPTQLLALVFCEGFFGAIPSQDENKSSSKSFFGDLTNDSPSHVHAEELLGEFLRSTEFRSIIPTVREDRDILEKALSQLRTMLMEDALDKSEQLKNQGDQFLMRYNAGRNTLLRGLPRFLRTVRNDLARH
jgi:hypothetical protein